MKEKLPKMNRLSKKIAKKVGLNYYDVDAILKVATFELVEILKTEQRFYWEGLGVFFVHISDTGLSVRVRLSEEPYNRLNEKDNSKEKTDEIIFE